MKRAVESFFYGCKIMFVSSFLVVLAIAILERLGFAFQIEPAFPIVAFGLMGARQEWHRSAPVKPKLSSRTAIYRLKNLRRK